MESSDVRDFIVDEQDDSDLPQYPPPSYPPSYKSRYSTCDSSYTPVYEEITAAETPTVRPRAFTGLDYDERQANNRATKTRKAFVAHKKRLKYWFKRPYYFVTSVRKSVWITILILFVVLGVVAGSLFAYVFFLRGEAPITSEQSYVDPITANSQVAEIVVKEIIVEVVLTRKIDK